MTTIDINCDMGEGFGNYSCAKDDLLFDFISSANIACGFHAGDYQVMEYTVKKAHAKGVAIGAHPGLPDLQGFGRREMKISQKEAYLITLYQIGALGGFVKAAGATLHHVKPHGALYNMAAKSSDLSEAIVQAIIDFDPALLLYALSGSEMIAAAERKGLRSVSEVFADRTYQDTGMLTPRTEPNALIHTLEQSLAQVLMMVTNQHVSSTSGAVIPIRAETICIHGDNQQALEASKEIYRSLTQQGIKIQAPLI